MEKIEKDGKVAALKNYLKRLRDHPGLPVVSILTPAFVLAGLANDNLSIRAGVIVGLVAAGPLWLIVLWTARRSR